MLDFYVVTVARVSARVLHDAVARRINRTSNRHHDVDAVVHPPYPEYRVIPQSVARDEATICRENRRHLLQFALSASCERRKLPIAGVLKVDPPLKLVEQLRRFAQHRRRLRTKACV